MKNKRIYKMIAVCSLIAVITTTFWTYTEAVNHYVSKAAAESYTAPKLSVEERIKNAANGEYTELLLNLAQCESYTNEYFHGVNSDGTVDRGVFAINSYQQSHVTDECAFNVECATRYTLSRIKGGDLHLWLCVKKI